MNLEGTLVKDLSKDTLLYADKLKVRITDWFFLKDTLVLKFIGLEDAQVHLTRKDSTWNYRFLADYFSPKSTQKSTKKSTLKFDLQKLDFKNISFVQNDLWVGTKMEMKLGSLQLDADNFNMDESIIRIKELDLDRPFFSIQNFDGLRPPALKKKAVNDSGYYFNPGDMQITAGKINIRNGTFNNEKLTEREPYRHFDGLHIRFEKLNGTLNNISFIKDTIKAAVNLSGVERSGFEIQKLKAAFKLTPQIMEFSGMDLITPKSHLQDYYAMSYKDFNADFNDYMHKVVMTARFKNSKLDTDDLAYFAPELKSRNRIITLSGTGRGTVDSLAVKNLFAGAGSNTVITGDLSMIGLPDIETTRINFYSGNIRTTYRDAVLFMPSIAKIKSPSLASLGNILFKGNFNGTIRKFVTAGAFSTNLGGFTSNVTMEFPLRGAPVYSGRVVTKQFNIGKFLLVPNLGRVSFDGTVKGQGLALESIRTRFTGNIQQIEFNNYNYANIVAEGTFQKKQFDGSIKIDDENLNLTTAVRIDLRGEQPSFNILGDLVSSNLQNLHLVNRRIEGTGLLDFVFTGSNIDQFLGSAKIFNANFLVDSIHLNFDSLSLQSRFAGGRRLLSVASNEFDAKVEGEYSILDLSNSFQLFLHKYYPAYIREPRTAPKKQRLLFEVNTRNVDDYTRLLDKRLAGFSNSSISGRINTIDSIVFNLSANVPGFAYDRYHFTNTVFNGDGNLDSLLLKGEIGEIKIGDSTTFPNTRITILSQGDLSRVSIQTKATNTLNEANFNADVYTLPDGVRIRMRPSDFVINDKHWILEKEGEIILRKQFVSAENVRFTQGIQEIVVETRHDDEFDQSNLVVRLKNINIGDFTPLVTKDPRMEGVAGGEVVLKDFFGKFRVEGNIRAEQFRLDNDSIGVVKITGGYNNAAGKVFFNVESPNEQYNLTGEGYYDLKDSVGAPLSVTMKLNKTRINIVNRFLNTVFDDITGLATGELNLNGNPGHPDLTGRVRITDGALSVKFTKVRYTIDSASFVFTDSVMNFGQFVIKDKFGHTGTVKGRLFQRGFRNMRFDFNISSNRMLLIDTKANDNQQFYGTAIGKASVRLTGPEANMRMVIAAEPTDSSHIYIPTTTSRESGEADYIVFKQYGTEMRNLSARSETNITVDLDLTANPLATIEVILDEVTGDIIKATGNGRLKIHAGTTDNLTINGRYTIQQGSYDFNFQSFIKKPFILKEDAGSYIEWNGDPYNAKIQIDALYIAENVRLGDLVANQGLGGAVQGYKGDVYVYATLSGNLKKPDITFHIDFPTGSQVKNDDSFMKLLNTLERDDNEMLKQVTYLIVFGSFAPYGEGRNLGSNITNFGFNTISEMISKQVNNLVSNLLYKITGDRSLQFDVSTSLYNSSSLFSGSVTATNNIDRQQVNFKLGKSLFDNKVIITFGGDLDFRMGNSSAGSQQLGNLQWLPDLTVEIILSKDRKVRAIIFSRNNLDITQGGVVGRRNRQGASISFREDFSNLFARKPDEEEAPKDSSVQFR